MESAPTRLLFGTSPVSNLLDFSPSVPHLSLEPDIELFLFSPWLIRLTLRVLST